MLSAPRPLDPFLDAALEEALVSYRAGGVPIGSVLVRDGVIIARGHNRRVQDGNPIMHAEMNCFQNAGRMAPSAYRSCTLYSTLSPCHMCSGTTILFGVPRVVVGESRTFNDAQAWLGSTGTSVTVVDDAACHEILQRFIAEQPAIWAEDIATEHAPGTARQRPPASG